MNISMDEQPERPDSICAEEMPFGNGQAGRNGLNSVFYTFTVRLIK